MSYSFQVTFDAGSPHEQADWWAETLGWQVEPQDEAFIRRMIDEGHATEADTTRHRGALVWSSGAAIVPLDGAHTAGPPQRLLFQTVPEEKVVKNRVHLDVRVGDDDIDEVADRLVARGATFLHHGREGPYRWVTLADPEGNEFCIT